jgi:hypothetical protein
VQARLTVARRLRMSRAQPLWQHGPMGFDQYREPAVALAS